jgi:phosphatidylserine decarboxylase
LNVLVLIGALAIATSCAIVLSWKAGISINTSLFWGIIVGLIAYIFVALIIPDIPFIPSLAIVTLIIFMLGILIIAIRFYRDPDRDSPIKNRVILAPADGKIKYIKKIDGNSIPVAVKNNCSINLKDFTKTTLDIQQGYSIGIGMSIFDVHVNRAPVTGKITMITHFPGSFLSLKKFEALLENERTSLIFDTGEFKVGIVLIASRLVRKIVSYKKVGEVVTAGDRVGMIKFGSQTDILIPDTVTILVKEGEQVFAGQTIIAEY